MEFFVRLPVFLALLVTIAYTSAPHRHKVRHKHNYNVLQFKNHHVNEIREAFTDYKNSIQKPQVTFEDAIKIKPLRHHRRNDEKLSEELTPSVNEEKILAHPSKDDTQLVARFKRVDSGESHEKLTENFDEERDGVGDGNIRGEISEGVSSKLQVCDNPLKKPCEWLT
jgi:hypothetical protein